MKKNKHDRHVYRVTFHDSVKCHMIASNATAAIRCAITWRNAMYSELEDAATRKAVSPNFSSRDIRSVDHLARIDRVPRP